MPDFDPPADPLSAHAAAWAPLDLAVVTATGPDAVRFVDNFATASLSSLAIGEGTETFFTDARGWVLALATVLRTTDGLTILAAPGPGSMLRDHLERYHIREALDLLEASAAVASFLVTGAEAAQRLESLGCHALPEADGSHGEQTLAGIPVRIIRVTGQGEDGFWLLSDRHQADGLAAALGAANLPRLEAAELEAARIEAGFPLPIDIVDKTLPQELGRPPQSISFTKGCYLGQETVARLDAMGHVNRRLAVVALTAAEPPALPAAILLDSQPVGSLSSACRSPRRGCLVGLGLLQTRALASDRLMVAGGPARVVRIAGQPEPTTPEGAA